MTTNKELLVLFWEIVQARYVDIQTRELDVIPDDELVAIFEIGRLILARPEPEEERAIAALEGAMETLEGIFPGNEEDA